MFIFLRPLKGITCNKAYAGEYLLVFLFFLHYNTFEYIPLHSVLYNCEVQWKMMDLDFFLTNWDLKSVMCILTQIFFNINNLSFALSVYGSGYFPAERWIFKILETEVKSLKNFL